MPTTRTPKDPTPSRYGEVFDATVDEWKRLENDHDRMHPDRSDCGGVGACPMMREAVGLEHRMVEILEDWRVKP